MNISINKVRGIDCPSKYLVTVENKPVLFANTSIIASSSVAYINGNKDADLPIGTKRMLDKEIKKLNIA